MNFSLTLVSAVVFVINSFLGWAGITVGPEEVDGFVKVGAGLLSAVGIWYGRYRAGGIRWYGKKI